MYKVIRFFTDLTDDNHPYNVGDTFPRKGLDVTGERLAELSGKDNKQGVPLIRLVEKAADAPKPAAKRTKKAAEE